MIRFLEHSEIDKDRWNKALSEATNATIFADFDFLNIGNPNWCALVEDDYRNIMPLPVRSKLSIKYIYTPFFFNRLGIFSKETITKEKVKEFIDTIPKKYRQIDLVLNENNPSELIEQKSISMVSHQLDLSQSYLYLQSQYSQNTARNIRSAQKYELQYNNNASLREIIQLFRQNRGKKKAVRYKKRDYYQLMRMAHFAYNKGCLENIGIVSDNKLIAGAFFLKERDRVWFWFSGRDNTHAEKKAMFFLLNEYIKNHAGHSLILDFNGSMNENVARLYKGFGGIPYQYTMLHFTRDFYLGGLIRLYKAIKK